MQYLTQSNSQSGFIRAEHDFPWFRSFSNSAHPDRTVVFVRDVSSLRFLHFSLRLPSNRRRIRHDSRVSSAPTSASSSCRCSFPGRVPSSMIVACRGAEAVRSTLLLLDLFVDWKVANGLKRPKSQEVAPPRSPQSYCPSHQTFHPTQSHCRFFFF